MPFTTEDKEHLKNFQVEWVEPGEFLVSRSNLLFRGKSASGPFDRILAYPTSPHQSLAGRFQLGRRFLRHHYYNVFKFGPEKYFVSFGRSLAVWEKGHLRPITGAAREFRVLRSGFAFDGENRLYFGEYYANWEREEVHVYSASLVDARMEVIHTFPPKSIRHIHAVLSDPYDDAMWLLVGDVKKECRLYITRDQFKTLDVVGEGDESWRTTTLEFTKDHIYYASDGEFEQNRIYRIDRKTGQREVLADIEGTVLSSSHLGDDFFFAVSGEKCPMNPKGEAVLWHLDVVTGQSQRILKHHRKDLWHQAYFQLGQYQFPCRYSPGIENEVYFTARGFVGVDGHTFCSKKTRYVETIR